MDKLVFIALFAIIALIDWKTRTIHNYIVIPSIALGIYLTGNWHFALATLFFLWMLHYDEKLNEEGIMTWGGGDVKLFTMVAAFLGVMVIPIILCTLIFIKSYRVTRYVLYASIPVAPFALMASLMFLW